MDHKKFKVVFPLFLHCDIRHVNFTNMIHCISTHLHVGLHVLCKDVCISTDGIMNFYVDNVETLRCCRHQMLIHSNIKFRILHL